MKERPILFSGPMVRAILEGRKTMTRRVIKPSIAGNMDTPRGAGDVAAGYPFIETEDGFVSVARLCHYGQPGDRLWVRETWGLCTDGLPNDGRPVNDDGVGCLYRATEPEAVSTEDNEKPCPWRPSIHMPRWACRIVLEVTGVRVERVQSMTIEDAMAEGMVDPFPYSAFKKLWDSIYSAQGYGWGVNPWVWVVEFKRVDA